VRRTAALFACVLLAGGCASESRIEREQPAPLADFTPQARVQQLWSAELGPLGGKRDVTLAPVVDGDTLYCADTFGGVSALSAADGRLLWRTKFEAAVTAATGVGEGLVLVGTKNGEIIALDKASGERRWSAVAPSEVLAPPVAQAGVVVVQTVDGKLTGLSAKDGAKLWGYERSEPALSLRGTSTPIVVGDTVLTGFASGKVVALSLREGRLLWELAVAQPHGRNEIERLVDVDVPLLVTRDALFAASYQGKLVAIDAQTGRVNWSRDISTYSGMDADRSAVYATDERGQVLALDQKTGASLWRQEKLRARALSAPAYFDDAVVVGDFEGYVHWLARDDGRFIARYRLNGTPIRARAVAGVDALYVVDQDGKIAALRLERKQ